MILEKEEFKNYSQLEKDIFISSALSILRRFIKEMYKTKLTETQSDLVGDLFSVKRDLEKLENKDLFIVDGKAFEKKDCIHPYLRWEEQTAVCNICQKQLDYKYNPSITGDNFPRRWLND